MEEMLTPKSKGLPKSVILVMPKGVVAVKENDAVSPDTLMKLLEWQMSGVNQEDALRRLRLQLIPAGYTYSPWNEGR